MQARMSSDLEGQLWQLMQRAKIPKGIKPEDKRYYTYLGEYAFKFRFSGPNAESQFWDLYEQLVAADPMSKRLHIIQQRLAAFTPVQLDLDLYSLDLNDKYVSAMLISSKKGLAYSSIQSYNTEKCTQRTTSAT
jgi:hypothetical protein